MDPLSSSSDSASRDAASSRNARQSPSPDAKDRARLRLAEALEGERPLTAVDAHVALLLVGPEHEAWDVANRLFQELCRRELARADAHTPRNEDARLLGMVVEAASELGRMPTTRDFTGIARGRDGWPSAPTLIRRFGSWERTLARAGLLTLPEAAVLQGRSSWRAPRQRVEYTDNELIDALRWCARETHGDHRYVMVKRFLDWRDETRAAFARRGETIHLPAHTLYYKRWGGWPEACLAAELSHVPAVVEARRPAARRRAT